MPPGSGCSAMPPFSQRTSARDIILSMRNTYRIIEAQSERLGTEWRLVRQVTDDEFDVELVSRHSTRAEAENAELKVVRDD